MDLEGMLTNAGGTAARLAKKGKTYLNHFWGLAVSREYRTQHVIKHIHNRINWWVKHDRMPAEEAARLRQHLAAHHEFAEYIDGCGAHLAFEPLGIIINSLAGAAVASGYLDGSTLFALVLLDGPAMRTMYTSYQGVSAYRNGEELPIVAGALGLFPYLGVLAYPAQMFCSARKKEQKDLAHFLLYDSIACIGHLPIIGGNGNWLERTMDKAAAKVMHYAHVYADKRNGTPTSTSM